MTFDKIDIIPGPGGLISGSGTDTAGAFTIKGSFNPNVPACKFTKQYQGSHTIYYDGKYE